MSSDNNTLLRLSTTDPDCLFDNDIQEDLILKPNSQIELQNITFYFYFLFLKYNIN